MPEGHTLAYVANREADTVSVLDLDAMSELAAVPVGQDPVDIDGPRHALVDAQAGVIYVVFSYPDVVQSPHVATKGGTARLGYVAALDLDDLHPLGEARVQASAVDVAESADHGSLAVAHYDAALALANTADVEASRASIAVIQPASGVAAGTAHVSFVKTCVTPSSVVFGPDASRVYVACTGEDSLVVVDPLRLMVVARVPAGPEPSNKPYALAEDAAGTRLAVSNQIAQAVAVFSLGDSPTLLLAVALPGVPFVPSFLANGTLLVPLQMPSGTVVVDPTTGAVIANASYTDDECENPSSVTAARGRPHRFWSAKRRSLRAGDGRPNQSGNARRALEGVTVGAYPDRLAVRAPWQPGVREPLSASAAHSRVGRSPSFKALARRTLTPRTRSSTDKRCSTRAHSPTRDETSIVAARATTRGPARPNG